MINSNFGFTPLKEVWLGKSYPERFFSHLPSDIADCFSYITELTDHDTGRVEKFLQDRGIKVHRPVFDSIDSHIDPHNDTLAKPPVVPRDNFIVLDQTLYAISNYQGWKHCMNENTVIVDGASHMKVVNPPSVVRYGQDLYVDTATHEPSWTRVCEWMIEQAKHYRINICNTNGHSDAVFAIIKPGVIVTSSYKTDYSQSFPGWEIYRVVDFAPKRPGSSNSPYSWHVPNMQLGVRFDDYIGSQALNWVGNYVETVLDVNMLVLDEQNVLLMKENPGLIKWLEERGVTAHVFPLRTWSFWDGGWSCFTLDVHRDDTKQDLFPERGENGVYWRLK